MDVNDRDGKGVLIVWLRACVRGQDCLLAF